jgi:hypothetical protein
MKKSNLIPLASFKKITFNVSEEICSENLVMFIESNLKNNGIKEFSSMIIVYQYLDLTNEYFISYSEHNSIPLFEILHPLSYDYDVVLWENYYFLYRQGQLYYFQELNISFNEKELTNYLFKRFNFTVTCIKTLKEEEFNDLLFNHNIHSIPTINYYKKKKSLILFFMSVFFLVILLFTYYSYREISNDTLLLDYKKEQEQQKILFKYDRKTTFLDVYSKIFNQLAKHKIQLITIKKSSKKVVLKIRSQDKKVLIEFYKLYGKKVEIEYIKRIGNDFESMATLWL